MLQREGVASGVRADCHQWLLHALCQEWGRGEDGGGSSGGHPGRQVEPRRIRTRSVSQPVCFILFHSGSVWFSLVQSGSVWFSLVQSALVCFSLVQSGSVYFSLLHHYCRLLLFSPTFNPMWTIGTNSYQLVSANF